MFTIGAFVVIQNSNSQVLLCFRTDKMFWNLPGGRVESREAPWEAAVREVREETNLEVEIDELLGVFHKDYEDDIVFLFSAKVLSGHPKPTIESERLYYFSLESLPCDLFEPHRERIMFAAASRKRPMLITQTRQ